MEGAHLMDCHYPLQNQRASEIRGRFPHSQPCHSFFITCELVRRCMAQCSKESSESSFRAGRDLVMLCHSHFGERSSYQLIRMNFKADHLEARDNGRSAQSNTSPVIVKQATLEKDMETGFFKSNSGIWNPH